LISELLIDEQQVHALDKLNIELDAITQLAQQNKLIEAQLLAHGEVLSSRLLAQYLTQLDYKAQSFDARDLLLLKDGQLQHEINQKSCEVLNAQQFNVVTGFIAKDIDGETVTLGLKHKVTVSPSISLAIKPVTTLNCCAFKTSQLF
jgi:aspartokinase/homoserine dehydrogenase 2